MKKQFQHKKMILLLGLFLLGVNQLFWASTPDIATKYTEPSVQLSYVNILHSLMMIGEPLILIALGALLAHTEKNVAKAVKIWLFTVFLSVLVVTLYFYFQRDISVWLIYGSFLPLLRNMYPIVTGIILGLVFLPFYQVSLTKFPRWTYLTLCLIFLVPTLFDRDYFGFNGGNSAGASLCLFYLGVALELVPLRLTKPRLSFLTIGALVSNVALAAVMPLFSMTVHNDLSTSGRFYTASSFFTVLLALGIYLWSEKLPGPKVAGIEYIAIGTFILINLNDVISAVIAANEKITAKVSVEIFKFDALEVFGVLLCLWMLIFLLRHIPKLQSLRDKIEQALPEFEVNDADQWLADRFQALKKWSRGHLPYLLGLLGAYILAYLSFLLMNTSWETEINVDAKYNIFTYTLGVRQFQVLLTMLIFFLIFRFLWAITNRYWVAEMVTLLFIIIWTIAERLKIMARNEPILPSEFSMVKAWGSLLGMVEPWILISTLVGLFLAVGMIIFLEKHYPKKKQAWFKQIIWLLVPPLFFSGSFYLNHKDFWVHDLMEKVGNDPTFYNQLAGVQKNGPFIQFLNNLDVTIMERPANYSRKEMQTVAKRYQKRAQMINQTRTNNLGDQIVIYALSESFSDPTQIPGLTLANDPIPYIRSLKTQTTAGNMISSGYGGGTANMEYMALTGLSLANFSPTLPTPYTQLVPKQSSAPNITQYFPKAVAIHPYIGVYYSREEVYKNFGFDRFMYLGSEYPIKHQKKIDRNPYLSDETAYANTLDQIKQAKSGLFINLVTMQNHFPYYNNYYDGSERFEPSGPVAEDEGVKTMIKEFSMGIYHSDQATQKFIEHLDQIDRPITLVFYGDHLPGIYSNVDMQKYGLELHKTEYFIYSNVAAQRKGAKRLTKATKLVSPNDFPALTAKQTNAKVSAYYALLTDVLDKLPVITLDMSENAINNYNASLELVDEQGEKVQVKDLSREQKQLLHDYQLVQYDLTAGKQYLNGTTFL